MTQQILPKHAFERDDLSAGTADRRVDIKRFPQVVDGVWAGLGANVKQYANC
jgi:hypothetical protein